MFDYSIEKHSNTYTAMLEKSNFIVQKKRKFYPLKYFTQRLCVVCFK